MSYIDEIFNTASTDSIVCNKGIFFTIYHPIAYWGDDNFFWTKNVRKK